MKQNLQTKLERYTKSISQQSIDPSKIKNLGLTGAAAMAAIITIPVELNSQVVCGNQGAPTRTTGPCTGDLGFLNTYDCAFFDFDGDGNNELQIYYYAWWGVGSFAYAYVDPINNDLASFGKGNYTFGFTFPGNPIAQTGSYFLRYQDRVYVVPLTTGNGYGFITFDSGAHPFGTNQPTTLQPICCYHSALPQMWGAQTGINNLSEIQITTGAFDECPVFPLLPVEFSKFEATAKENTVLLEWTTESEVNNAGFEIERSVDGVNYREISFVEGNENSQRTNHYTYEDKTAIKGQEYYYRLKQIDFDGKIEYSDVKFATIASNEFEFSMSPNPAQDIVTVDLIGYQDEKVMIEIYSISGELISSESRVVGEDKRMSLDITNLSGAMYFVKITDSQVSKYKKLMVSK